VGLAQHEAIDDKGQSIDRCLLRRECVAGEDVSGCAATILRVAAAEAQLAAVGDGSDREERATQCRQNAADVLGDVSAAAARCRADAAKAARKGWSYDLPACIMKEIDRPQPRLAGLLAKAFEKGVTAGPPSRRVPAATDSAVTCASAGLDDAAGLSSRAAASARRLPDSPPPTSSSTG